MKVVIVGGVAGGASAATRLRRLNEKAQILLFERGQDLSFANCGMPYYIGGEIAERQKLLVVTPERLQQRYRIHTRLHTSVESIDPESRTVMARELRTGRVYLESYDKLILATGAAPVRPQLPGIDLPGILTLRNLEDMDRVHALVTGHARHVVIVGAGFIGLELAENVVHRGLKATVVELADQVLPPLDHEMTLPVRKELASRGVDLRLNESVTAFQQSSTGSQSLSIELKSGARLEADLVILGIGVKPENQLAVAAGLATGPRGGIRVTSSMQTSDPHIYAVGDVIETFDAVSNTPAQVPLAGPANRQGRLAADHICGRQVAYRGTQGTAIVRVFNLTAACTGLSEKRLRQLQRPWRKVYIHPAQHAGYFPGAQGMTLKLLFEPEQGRILGAQAVGGNGVDKRIDVLAMAIQGGLTVHDLEQAELAYAPQYGSAKDPVNMLGFVAAGILKDEHRQISVEEYLANPAARRLIDVRTATEFASGHIPGAINLPVDELRERLREIPQDQPVLTYCQVGQRGYLAQRILQQRGYDVVNLGGGYKTYTLYDAPVNSTRH